MTEDAELLRQYLKAGCEDAFAEVVQRYLPLVYSAALRQVYGNESLAKDVAQTVFIDLARKATSLLRMKSLAGWLYESTRFAASNAIRANTRRQRREQIAVAMQENTAQLVTGPDANELTAVLDEAMSELKSDERNIILLRFFQGMALKDVGAALAITEDTARMRINRSLGRLHSLLARRDVALSVTTLAAALTTETICATPAGLAVAVTSAAVANGAVSAGSTLMVLKILSMTKIKIGIVSALVATSVVTPLIVQHESQVKLRKENQDLLRQVGQLAELKAENERLVKERDQLSQNNSTPLQDDQARDVLRLRGQVAQLAQANSANSQIVNDSAVQKALKKKEREAKLKELLKERQNLAIPEFALLAEGDLNDIAGNSNLETEDGIRKAFASLRHKAGNNFAPMMMNALRKYNEASGGKPPGEMSELATYFDTPVDPAILERYQVFESDPAKNLAGWNGGWVVTQKEPVDGTDARWAISPVGFSIASFGTPGAAR